MPPGHYALQGLLLCSMANSCKWRCSLHCGGEHAQGRYAFDTVDHQLLLHRLERQYGLRGVTLAWFSSYLTDRSFRVSYNGTVSSVVYVTCSVPQGSVLGPRLFALYTADLDEVTDQHNVNLHSYADDSQLYVHCQRRDTASTIARIALMTLAIGWQQIVCR